MEIADVIKIRDTLKKIKYINKKKNPETGEIVEQELSVPLWVKLDNEVHIYETSMIVLWDDDNGLLWYYAYNSQNYKPDMIGRNKIVMPVMLCGCNYEQIQEIRAILNEDTLVKSLNILEPTVKSFITDTPESLTDKRKKIVISKFCRDTQPMTDYDMYVHHYNK